MGDRAIRVDKDMPYGPGSAVARHAFGAGQHQDQEEDDHDH